MPGAFGGLMSQMGGQPNGPQAQPVHHEKSRAFAQLQQQIDEIQGQMAGMEAGDPLYDDYVHALNPALNTRGRVEAAHQERLRRAPLNKSREGVSSAIQDPNIEMMEKGFNPTDNRR